MLRRRQSRSLVVAAALAWGAGNLAHADPSAVDIAVAKKLFAEAEQDEHEERWGDALAKLQRVVAIKETSGVRFHIAAAEEHVGKLLAAEADYRRSAELAEKLPEGERASLLDMASTALTKIGPKIPTVSVRMPANVSGAHVSIDGRELSPAELGRPLKHELGSAQIEAKAPGRTPFSQSVILIVGTHAEIEVSLQEAPVAATTAVTSAPVASTSSTAASPAAEPSHGRSYVAPIAVGAATLGLAVTSIVFVAKHGSLKSDSDALCADPTVICARSERDDRISEYSTIAVVTGAAAVVGLGVTTVLFVTGGSKDPSVGFSVGPGSASFAGRF